MNIFDHQLAIWTSVLIPTDLALTTSQAGTCKTSGSVCCMFPLHVSFHVRFCNTEHALQAWRIHQYSFILFYFIFFLKIRDRVSTRSFSNIREPATQSRFLWSCPILESSDPSVLFVLIGTACVYSFCGPFHPKNSPGLCAKNLPVTHKGR